MKLKSTLVPWLIVSLGVSAIGVAGFFVLPTLPAMYSGGVFALGVVGCLVVGAINQA